MTHLAVLSVRAMQWALALAVIVFAVWTATVLGGCAAFAPQLRLVEPALVDDPKFGSCVQTGTTLTARETQFALLTSICMQRVGDAGVALEPPEPVSPPKPPTDAGVEQ